MVEISKLSNGLTVVTEAYDHLASASVGVWVDAGARYERIEDHGIAHLLEHMAFKGTERRSAWAIAEEIETVGGHLNAYTGRDQTAYFARILKDDIALAVDILSDILQYSSFAPEELQRERTVVMQEIGQAIDTPDDIVFDYLQEAAFPQQAFGRSILGTLDSVAAHSPDSLKGFMRNHYAAPHMVLAAAGAVNHAEIVALAENSFGNLPAERDVAMDPAKYKGGEIRQAKDLEQAHVTLGFSGVSLTDPLFYASQVLSTILGGGMSSRLFQEVREKRGLCYSIFTFASSAEDCGLFGLYAGTAGEDVAELMPVVAGELLNVTENVSSEELTRAKNQLKAATLMALESPSSRTEQLARQMLIFGRPLTADEIAADIDAVDIGKVQKTASLLFKTATPTIAAVGPISALADYGRISAAYRA